MSLPQSEEAIGNLLRLKGLKNVAGRRRVAGQLPEFMEDEIPDYDFKGIENSANKPIADLNYGGVAPESYDVRANQVILPPEEPMEDQESGTSKWTKLGQSIAKYVENQNNPPVNENEEKNNSLYKDINYYKNTSPESFEEPNENALAPLFKNHPNSFEEFKSQNEQREQEPGILSKIGKYLKSDFEGLNKGITPEIEQQNPEMFAKYPEVIARKEQAQLAKDQEQEQARIESEKALENPFTTAVYGSSNQIANQPDLQAEFKDITGIDYDKEIAKRLPEYEKVMSDIQENLNNERAGYTEQESRLRDKIISNNLTDQDKLLIGMALLVPLIVGGFFGKEAALGALGGGAKGLTDVLQQKGEENLQNEKLLADIASKKSENQLKQSELQFKTLALPETIRKSLPDDIQEFLKGKKEVIWNDPKDGKEMKGILIKPGVVAYPEFVANKEELKEIRNEANDISDALTAVKEVNYLTDDIIDISSKMKDKNILGQAFASALSDKNPGLASKNADMVEFQGRQVNAYIILEHKIKLLSDAYRQAKGMRALTQSVQDHIEGLFRNPQGSFQSHQDTIDQMIYTRDLALERLGNNAKDHGFAPEFLYDELKPKIQNTFNNLNYREGEKESDKFLGK